MDTATRDAIMVEITAAQAVADIADREKRDFTADERTKVTAHMAEANRLKARAQDRKDIASMLDGLATDVGLPEGEEKTGGEKRRPEQFHETRPDVSLGQSFVDSPEFKAMIAGAPGGRFGKNSRVQSAPFGVKDLITGTNRTTGAGSLLVPQQLGMLDPFYARPLTIRQLVTNGTTTTDVIEYVRLVSVTNNAAPVPEATRHGAIGSGDPAVTGVTGGVKPESGMVFEKDTTNIKTLAHWIPATKRALSDVGQVRTLIDSFLRYGLEEEVEDQIVSGDGTGENFEGLANTSGIQTQGAPTGDDTVHDTTRRARRKVRIGGRAIPTAYVLNPIDWENIELMKDTTGRYYGAGPFAMTTPTLWGLPVVESEAVPAGTGYVGDWTKAVLWDREQASIQVTDAHADFFIRNLVAILAELRAAFAVLRPAAFCRITF